MIHRISSTLTTFKNLKFHSGLNILLAQKEAGATEKQTRNRAGKSSLIEIIHFIAGANVEKDSIFRSETLKNESFSMTFDLGGELVTARRSGKEAAKLHIEGAAERNQLSNTEWITLLGEKMFWLNDLEGHPPSFRLLFPYFVRRQNSGGFFEPEKQATMQQLSDIQATVFYLLGLDWQIAGDWKKVRDREKTLKELKKAAGAGAFGSFIGKASELRTQLTVAEARLKEMQEQLSKFRVLPQYSELRTEADQLTRQIKVLDNANTADNAAIQDLEAAIHSESPPPLDNLENIYAEAGVSLPGLALKRYEEVQVFHESVIRNRRNYLASELEAARQRVAIRKKEQQVLDDRRTVILTILNNHGALEQFSLLQAETSRKVAEVESLRQRFIAAEQLESTKNELHLERSRLELRLRRELAEQHQHYDEAILAFEATSERLYESAGSMNIAPTSNGPQFDFPMQGSSSKGIKNMQIFCFDMMLMRLCAQRGIGPGFLVHDSHLFDGVDGRQLISALKVGAETAEELDFQYIVTMNEDDVFKEKIEGFDVQQHVLPVKLTDATEDGGLFGCRF